MERGTIVDLKASFGSGIITLIVQGEDGKRRALRGDNGPTSRALISMCGRRASQGHSLIRDCIIGTEILYVVDDLGLLQCFADASRVNDLGDSIEDD